MAALLSAFLSAAAAHAFVWGRHDCMLFAADWALALTGRDPAAQWRGTYDDEAGARLIMERAGGAHELIAAGLGPGWLELEIEAPAPGDIVIAQPPLHPPTAGVIDACGTVALASKRGLVVWPARVLAAWRVGAILG